MCADRQGAGVDGGQRRTARLEGGAGKWLTEARVEEEEKERRNDDASISAVGAEVSEWDARRDGH